MGVSNIRIVDNRNPVSTSWLNRQPGTGLLKSQTDLLKTTMGGEGGLKRARRPKKASNVFTKEKAVGPLGSSTPAKKERDHSRSADP